MLSRTKEISAQLAAARKLAGELAPKVQEASVKLAAADSALQAATAEATVARTALETAEAKARDAREKFRGAKATHGELTARVADAQVMLDYHKLDTAAVTSQAAALSANEQLTAVKSQGATTGDALAESEAAAKSATEKAAADRAAAEQAWSSLAEKAGTRFTLAALKPLSPEQLAWATMQATGQVDGKVAALAAQARKEVEAMKDLSPEARAIEEARILEARVNEKLRGNLRAFESLFGQQPGQPPTFQPTVHQALFLANGGALAGWLNPGGNNLTERLAKIEDAAAVGEELYLSVLTRRPTADEQAKVVQYWEAGKADRAAAAREIAWALLVSAEFRFNH
jgi:hypothetical protein